TSQRSASPAASTRRCARDHRGALARAPHLSQAARGAPRSRSDRLSAQSSLRRSPLRRFFLIFVAICDLKISLDRLKGHECRRLQHRVSLSRTHLQIWPHPPHERRTKTSSNVNNYFIPIFTTHDAIILPPS